MGLFGGSSKSSTSQYTTNNTLVQNPALEDIQGIALANSDSARINILDGGAIAALESTAGGALGAVSNISADALRIGGQVNQGALDLASYGLDNAQTFGLRALDAISAANESALLNVSQLARSTSASTDDRVESIAKESMKTLMIGLAVAMLAPLLLSKLK